METLLNMRAGTNHWDEGRSHDSAMDTDGDAAEGRDKHRGDASTEDDGEDAPAPKVSAPVPADVTDVETTQSKLWELQRLLPQQPEREPKRHIREEHRGEHQGLRSQPEDLAGRGHLGRRI